MCGIAGILTKHLSVGTPALLKATAALNHRGPEDEAFWYNAKATVALGHRRLCIIDLSKAAAQPMHYAERFTIVYNGEIYNYKELKNELQQKGYSFHSHSDTEVILAAYAAWGADCLQRFDGAFAFALWDEKEQTLFAARDRFGEKPFSFFYDKARLAFASEIKALWEMDIEKEVNESLLYNFLTIGYTGNPSDATETFYDNIHKLPAAHYLTYSLAEKKLHTHRYWQVYVEVNHQISEEDALAQFDHLFKSSIHKRLRSDVAIGTSLSGGLDSSAIVAYCANEHATQYSHKCFTAAFPGFEKDETQLAAQVAEQFRLQHFTATIAEDDLEA